MTNNEITVKQIQEIGEAIAKLQECYDAIENNLNLYFMDLIKSLPEEIESIGWRQWTPYFMDGDPCKFSVDADNILVNGVHWWDGGSFDDSVTDERVEELYNNSKLVEFAEILSSIPDEYFESRYDNDSEVTITREGITVSEFSNHG